MTTYAILVTFALGLLAGIIVNICWNEWYTAYKIAAVQKSAEKDSADMDAAVELVTEKLGGTILDYGPNV